MAKLMSLREAVERYTEDGCKIAFAGTAGRASFCFAYELIRRRRRGLTFCSAGTAGMILDLLVGAGVVDRAEVAFTLLNAHNIKRRLEGGPNLKTLQLEDYSNLAMVLRFMASALSLPFIPVPSMKGSDLEAKRGFLGKAKLARIRSPFDGYEEVVVLPPCRPQLAVMHAQYADEEGNLRILGPIGPDDWTLRAAERIVVTVERIIEARNFREEPEKTFLPGFAIDAIVETRFGAHPGPLAGFYAADRDFQAEMVRSAKEGSYDAWLERWVLGVRDHEEYLEKLGERRLSSLIKGAPLARR